jgi:2-desacetyl-2-hydroxyethyl bacteriochlorophyllide A dehydrogenase
MQPSTQRVLMLQAPREARFADVALPPAGPRDVVVRSQHSTFKHGTEMMAYLGRTPLASRVFNPSLRLFETAPEPQPFYPRPMGSMVVGTVEWAGGAVDGLRPGDQVFGWAPIADVHVMPAASLRPLGELAPEAALCIDPASFALGGTLDGAIGPSDTVLVTGLGAIGLFTIQYCAALGAKVMAASRFDQRRRLAKSCGAGEVYDPDSDVDVARAIKENMGGVDAAIECSGSLDTLTMAIRAARQCGRVVCVGFYGAGSLNLGEEFFHNRLTLLASLPAFSWNNPVRGTPPLYAKDLQEIAARDFRAGKIKPGGILAPTLAFRDAERAVKLIAEEPQRVVKVLLRHD